MPITTQSYIYPTSLELSAIDQQFLPILSQSNPIFRDFPIKEVDADTVAWEQRENYRGLMNARGVEGEYPAVQTRKLNRYELTPGRYGEHFPITGEEMEKRRGFGQVAAPINIKDLVIERTEQAATRQYQLMAYLAWTLVNTGFYTVLDYTGTVVVKREAIISQQYTGSAWGTPASGTPLADFRGVKLKHRGYSTLFDRTATAYMNTVTFNKMIANSNANDLGGRRSTGLETVEGLEAYNKAIALKDNLPMIEEYDDGYIDGNGVFQPYIPDNTTIIIGKRTNGAPIGDFCLTRNADNGLSSAPLVKVVHHGLAENEAPPVTIKVFRGFNGGPRIYYPSSIVVMTTT